MNSIDELFPSKNGDNSDDIKVGEKDIITAISVTLKEISDGNQKTLTDITNTFTESLKSVVKNAGVETGTEPESEAGAEAGAEDEAE